MIYDQRWRCQRSADMMGKQLAKAMLTKAVAHKALHYVHARTAVPLNDYGAVAEHCNVPTDYNPVVEVAVSGERERL